MEPYTKFDAQLRQDQRANGPGALVPGKTMAHPTWHR